MNSTLGTNVKKVMANPLFLKNVINLCNPIDQESTNGTNGPVENTLKFHTGISMCTEQ